MLEQSSTNIYTCSQLSSHNIQLLHHHIDKYNHHHHHHSGSCNEHTSIILCARAARKQTTTSGAATTYYHHYHTVQVTILRPPHAFLDENDRHHHHTVQVSMHAFSICAIALEKTPPSPPPHSASYNIAATTTCVSRVSVLVGHRKRLPPVQVTVATTTCASRVSVLVGHRKRPPVQVTVAPDQHTHHSHHHMCLKVNALNG